MEDLPIKHRNHELETLSERFFINNVPSSWVLNPLKNDYGTDYNCEIAIERKVTGINFSVQLKGKETEKLKQDIHITLKRTTINRWLNKLEPTMVIVYIADEGEAYWTWFQDGTVNLTLPNDTFTIKILRENRLSTVNWDSIIEYVRTIFNKRHLLYSNPHIDNKNRKAWDLYYNNEIGKALPLFYELLQENPNDASVLEVIAISEYQLLNYQKALIYINKALEIEQNDGYKLNKASILTEQGARQKEPQKIQNAIAIYEHLIDKNYTSDTLFYNCGCAYIKLGLYEIGISYFKEAIDINPNKAEYWNNLGNAYLNCEEHLLELKCYDNALKINPNLAETIFSKGSSLFRYFGQIDEGLALMIKSTKLTDRHRLDNPYVFFWISEAYLSKEDYDHSEKWNEEGLNYFSTDSFLLSQKERIKNREIIYKQL